MPEFKRWNTLAEKLGIGTENHEIFDRLAARYCETGRPYHNADHLDHVLAEFDSIRHFAADPAAIETAIWFHDAIYDPRASDNEEQSARLAAEELAKLGLAPDAIRRVEALILATRHRDPPQGIDEEILLDADLAILGAAPERFDAYEKDIRREYAHVSDADFRIGRSTVLQSFLSRPRLFHTAPMFVRYETAARANLARSLRALAG